MDYLNDVKEFIMNKWKKMTAEHIIYLIIFALILSYITEYILKIKYIKWLYYTLVIVLISRLVRTDHPLGAAESVYKLIWAI